MPVDHPLKFLYVTTFYPPYSFGGDAVYLHRLSHALAGAGHTVDVLHCVDSYHLFHPAEPEIRFAEHPRVRRHELRSGAGWLGPLLAHQTGRPVLTQSRLKKIFASDEFDVVHYHNISLLGPGVLAMQARGARAVKLYTTHEHWLICPMHVLWKYNSRVCEKPDCFTCTLRGRRPPQVWRHTGYLKQAVQHVDQFLSPSRFTAEMHARRGFPRPVAHLPYFLERCDEEWRNPAARPQERPYFLFVGRLEWIKGLHTLIEAWTQVHEWDLLVAGSGSRESEFRRLASSNPRVRFLGAQSQAQLAALYTHALATIVPSVTYETFGIIIIESFARKTPVIVHDLGALSEVVQDSGGGFVFRDGNELLRHVSSLAGQPDLRNELGERGYQAFLRHWETEAHLKAYFGYIRQARERKFGSTEEWLPTSSPAARDS